MKRIEKLLEQARIIDDFSALSEIIEEVNSCCYSKEALWQRKIQEWLPLLYSYAEKIASTCDDWQMLGYFAASNDYLGDNQIAEKYYSKAAQLIKTTSEYNDIYWIMRQEGFDPSLIKDICLQAVDHLTDQGAEMNSPCSKCHTPLVHIDRRALKQIKKVVNPTFVSIPKEILDNPPAEVQICFECDAYALGGELAEGFTFYDHRGHEWTVQDLEEM